MNDLETLKGIFDRAGISYQGISYQEVPSTDGAAVEIIVQQGTGSKTNLGYICFFTVFSFINGDLKSIGGYE